MAYLRRLLKRLDEDEERIHATALRLGYPDIIKAKLLDILSEYRRELEGELAQLEGEP